MSGGSAESGDSGRPTPQEVTTTDENNTELEDVHQTKAGDGMGQKLSRLCKGVTQRRSPKERVVDDVVGFSEPPHSLTRIQSLHANIETHSPWPQHVIRAAIAYHAHSHGDPVLWSSVLDLGCGFGSLLPQLGQNFDKVIGIDPSSQNIDLSRLLVNLDDGHLSHLGFGTRRPGVNFELFVGKDTDLPALVPDASLECIIAASSAHLWEWSRPDEVFDRLARALRPAGSLILLGNKPMAGFFSGARRSPGAALSRLTADPPLPDDISDCSGPRYGADLYDRLPKPWDIGGSAALQWDPESFAYWVFAPKDGSVPAFLQDNCHSSPPWLPEEVAGHLVNACTQTVEGHISWWTPGSIAAWVSQVVHAEAQRLTRIFDYVTDDSYDRRNHFFDTQNASQTRRRWRLETGISQAALFARLASKTASLGTSRCRRPT